tara:strand:- start:176 stop:337 length:162 start_codon:yes stop_codon:yes gene_type:complete
MTKQEEEIHYLSEELKNLFFYEPYNDIAINRIVSQLDKLRLQGPCPQPPPNLK